MSLFIILKYGFTGKKILSVGKQIDYTADIKMTLSEDKLILIRNCYTDYQIQKSLPKSG